MMKRKPKKQTQSEIHSPMELENKKRNREETNESESPSKKGKQESRHNFPRTQEKTSQPSKEAQNKNPKEEKPKIKKKEKDSKTSSTQTYQKEEKPKDGESRGMEEETPSNNNNSSTTQQNRNEPDPDIGKPKKKDGEEMLFKPGEQSFFDSLARKEGVFWVDNTRYIAEIEKSEAKALIWLRPRRFGKTLFLNTLDAYYNCRYYQKLTNGRYEDDENYKEQRFQELFGHLWIGKHKTQEQGTYNVMTIDFGGLKTDTVELFEKILNRKVNGAIKNYFVDNKLRQDLVKIDDTDCVATFENFILFLKEQSQRKLLLLIDEYDTALNGVLSNAHFMKSQVVVEGESEAEKEQKAFARFFHVIKEYCGHRNLKVFITGVTPIVLSLFTSGFNNPTYLHQRKSFFYMNGFTEADVRRGLEFIEPKLKAEQVKTAIDFLQRNYNGYRFAPRLKEGLFNSNLILHFLDLLQENKNSDQSIEELLPLVPKDINSSPTKNSLKLLAGPLAGKHYDVIPPLFRDKFVQVDELQFTFDLSDLNNLGSSNKYIYSLMYYFGALTYMKDCDGAKLTIPNSHAKSEIVERLWEIFRVEKDTFQTTCKEWISSDTKDFTKVCKDLRKIFHNLQNQDHQDAEKAFSAWVFVALTLGLQPDSEGVTVEKEGKLSSQNQYTDLRVETKDSILIFELKNCQTDYLEEWKAYAKAKHVKQQQGKYDWDKVTEWDQGTLANKSDEEVLAMKGKFFLLDNKPEDTTIKGVMDNGVRQLKEYMKTVKKEKSGKTIHGYVLIRVGLSTIVFSKV